MVQGRLQPGGAVEGRSHAVPREFEQGRHHFRGIDVVVDDQHPAPLASRQWRRDRQRGRRRCLSCCRCCRCRSCRSRGQGGQRHDELAALAENACRADGAAVQIDESLHQAQADAQAPLRAVERAVGLSEQIEDVGQQLGRNTDAGVAHPQHRRVALQPYAHADAAAIVGVLGSVGEQVDDHLLQAGGVCVQPDGLWRQRHGEHMPMLRDERLRRLHRPFDDAFDADPFPPKPNPTGADAGDIQQIVDQVRQLTDLARDDAAGLQLDRVLVRLPAQQHQGVADRRQRVAEFVAQHRQELVLAAGQIGQRLGLFQGLALQPVARGDVLEDDRDAAQGFRFEPENIELQHPLGGREITFEADRYAGREHRFVGGVPILGDVGHHLPDGLADHVVQTRLNLEGRIGFEVAKIRGRTLPAAHPLDDAEALVDRVEQGPIALLALAQLGLCAQALQLRPDACGQLARDLDLVVAPVVGLGVIKAQREAPLTVLQQRHAKE